MPEKMRVRSPDWSWGKGTGLVSAYVVAKAEVEAVFHSNLIQ